ncbi:MAG TPA: gliding motility-associated C-terminal domain-containing protein [Bacteroidia bacterium]|nr:gliding motility-associated C-terminal domain-containing protein [Bacteroidia bacterium]
MTLKNPIALKFLFLAFLSLNISNVFGQSNASKYVEGACLNCVAQDEEGTSNAKTMNGNQANVTSYTATSCGLNYVYGSVKLGKRGPIGGVTQPAGITISGLPTGCTTILKAFLYGDASGTGIAVTSTVVNPALVSSSFPMTIIGSGPDKCWGYSGSYSYRADITPCITGNGNYAISGLPTNPPIAGNDFDGATIVIIYADPTQTYTGHLIIADGAHVAAPGTITDIISMPAACANSTYADGFIIAGDLQGIANTPFRLNSATPNYTFPAVSNSWWNAFQATAAPVTSGQTTATFGAQNSGDCYNVVVSGLYYRTTCNTCTFSPGTMSLTAAASPSCSIGTATASPIGGTGPYTYSWTPTGATTQTVSGAPGIYTVTVKDAACAQVTTTVSLSALAPITINTTINQPSCLFPPGVATATVGGGATATSFTVIWSPTPGTVTPTSNGSIATGLTAGPNTVIVTDASGCSTNTTFTVSITAATSFSVSASGQLNCVNTTVTLTTVNTSTLGNMTYTWMPGNTNGATYTTTSAGVYTVTGQDLVAGSCALTQTVSVSQNTTAPTITVNPITASITCNGACKTFTATTAANPNVFGTWYDPFGNAITPASGTPVIMCANAPGNYVATFTNTTNGCKGSQTISVTSNTAVPTISVTSVLGGYVINCTKPCLPLNINSSGTLAPTTYTWTNLTTSVVTSPPGFNGGYTVCTTGPNTPGSYEAAFMDGNFCKVTTTINITIDTLRPSPLSVTNLASNSYTINCFTPSLVATALTNPLYSPSSYSWTQPPNLIINSNTVSIGMVNIPSSVTPVTYTVSAMSANGCVGKAKVFFYKDIYVPPYGVAYTPTAITCANPCVALTATTAPSTTTGVTYTFTSPPPTATATTAGALMCTPGIYTLTYQNVNNGCFGSAVTTVDLNVTPPTTMALSPIYLPCGQTTTVVFAGVTNSTSNTYSYTWDPPPLAGMSCPGGTPCVTSSVNAPGNYNVFILNTVNGCSASNSVSVIAGNISASITPDPAFGFAPLTVNFNNTSVGGSTTAGTVTTVWNYGNGISMTYTGTAPSYSLSGYPNGASVYQAAGSYTVWLILTQNTGTNVCVGTASTVIFVDLQSKLDIPNVFTPNGDGVNDYFTLLTTNITNITCKIFDRWGVKMYDVTSDKGNISWDGKNFSNKDVPAGTYFYILTAEGKDGKTTWTDDKGKEIKQTGTISLYR